MRPILACLALLFATPAGAQNYNPAWSLDVQGTKTPGLDGVPLFLWNAPPAFDSSPTLRIDRHVAGTGQAWNTYKGLWVLGSTNPNNVGFEWTISGEQHNTALASGGAQNVAVNGTIWKDPNGVGPVGPSWGGNFICSDTTGEIDPVASCIGAELDTGAKAIPGRENTDKNRQRVVLQLVGGGGEGVHTGYGILMGVNGGTIDRAFAPLGSYGIGLDFTAAGFSKAPIMLGPEQWLAIDGKADGSFGRFVGFHAGQFTYMTPFGPMLRIADDGAVSVGRVVETMPHVPATSNAPCVPGDHAWDAAFEYRCIAPNRWRRAALADW